MKHYKWVKEKINKILTAKVIQGSQSSWSAPIIVVSKGDGGKHLVTNYHALTKDHLKLYLAYTKHGRHFLPIEWCEIFFNFGYTSRISPHPIR